MTKPSIPRGTRDFGPEVVRKRQYIFNTIRNVFELYGFQPLETPAMENIETLMGKYGEEGDKLIFKILNNGLDNKDKEEKTRAALEKVLQGKTTSDLTERALKYDLTIPFARYVAMNHNQLTFPFKRYQIQPVWRADNPQRGRYREFTQCDADVVGSRSLLNEVELVNIYHTVFMDLGLKGYELRINSRKILTALAERCGGADQMINITIAIDKLDKIGLEKVKEELVVRGLKNDQIDIIEQYLKIDGSNEEKLKAIADLLTSTDAAAEGIAELRTVTETVNLKELIIDFTLARGLNYYTGIIFEAKAPPQVKMGSIGGGGRYDDLTGLFGVPNIPGVGISFGVDRIYDVLEEMNHFPPDVQVGTQVLLFNLGEAESKAAYKLMQELRLAGIRSELFHENTKFDKQFKYAEKKGIPYAIIIGSQELAAGEAVIKDLRKGTQLKVTMADAACYVFG
ncbi:histidine--tRNA ligase [Pseudobacter ginsenosidimutans]|uniref:Histidine--tRNA ligase n=1 Tax=Pseudobacter ginsenosidimutans TaxID=661488 RepID=A0A4Q7MUI0_9BACT|nr:histidine--tRNA ligase [Pseudobacter ginsenosidimutans]QEC40739.1 histidine--tRNA ligase [Pseudobacter ginsenosidimutans]RZS72535.1 histidyl-tRNA synthetase [Pseudobacter ginsenosidimutans]